MRVLFFLVIFFSTRFLQAYESVDIIKEKMCNHLVSMHGWCSREKALNFFDLVIESKPEVCVEIGIFAGRSIYPVACALKHLDNGIVIGIDAWDNFECIKNYDPIVDQADLNWWSSINMDEMFYSYMNMINRFRLQNYCVTIKSPSRDAISEIEFIDILHIDGNHGEQDCTENVILYLPKVRQGGYIWMNDTLWGTTQDAVDILLQSCDVIKLIDNGNCILFKKR